MDFFYDAQIERYLLQIVKAFSLFKYQPGPKNGVVQEQIIAPCHMAITSKMVANILRNNSSNTMLSVPQITVSITGLKPRKADIQGRATTSKVDVWEREIDSATGNYTSNPGRKYTVERFMPSPFELQINIDIWTSNTMQKLQLLEQILVVTFPDFPLQSSDNPIDQGSYTVMEMDDVTWSSRNVPIGTSDDIDIATLSFKLPIWLSPPAKVTQQNIIQQINTNLNLTADPIDNAQLLENNYGTIVTTPGDHSILVNGGSIKLLGAKGENTDIKGNPFNWNSLFLKYGTYRPAMSKLLLKNNNNMVDPSGIVGTVQISSGDPSILFWQIDPTTLPSNTLTSVNNFIDPLQVYPGNNLPSPNEGDRYLIISGNPDFVMASNQAIWGNLRAKENDIIQYTNGQWSVATYDKTIQQYMVDNNTGTQVMWNVATQEWALAIGGKYPKGMWRISL